MKNRKSSKYILQSWTRLQDGKTLYTFLTDVLEDENYLSFGEIKLKARILASRLLERGLCGETLLTGLDLIVAFFGCLYVDMIAVPANFPRRRHDRLTKAQLDSFAELKSSFLDVCGCDG